jgi:hypothetical protein
VFGVIFQKFIIGSDDVIGIQKAITPKIGFGSPGTYRLLDRPRLESPAAEDLPLRNRFTVKRQ